MDFLFIPLTTEIFIKTMELIISTLEFCTWNNEVYYLNLRVLHLNNEVYYLILRVLHLNNEVYYLNLRVNLNHDVSYQNHRFINLNIGLNCLHNLTWTKGVISAKHGNLSPEPSRFFI